MKKIVALGIAVVVLIAGTTVWACRRHRVDPKVQQIVQAQQKAFDDQVTDEQRRAMFDQFRSQMRTLTDGQRRQVFDQMRPLFQRRENERMDAYFNMTPDEKVAYLNKQIAEMQKRQEEREARRAAEQAQGGSNGQGGNGSGGPGAGGPAAGGPGGGGPGSGGPGGRPGRFDQQARNNFRNQMLNNSTPQQRAQRTQYMQDFRQQCLQQGVSPPTRGFGGGGRF
jgi:uncharacterized membrane protein YgcG